MRFPHDVTRPLSPRIAAWPGDEPFTCGFSATRADGAAANVGWIRQGVHNGTHVDAPYHFLDGGATVDALPLEAFHGPCRVVRVPETGPLEPSHVGAVRRGERILLRTRERVDPTTHPSSYVHPTPALAAHLVESGAVLLGTDAPSVDGDDDRMPAHRALAEGNVQILENLDLGGVPDGAYTLVAFPMRLEGMDGAPVRAVLLPP